LALSVDEYRVRAGRSEAQTDRGSVCNSPVDAVARAVERVLFVGLDGVPREKRAKMLDTCKFGGPSASRCGRVAAWRGWGRGIG
jgi:hypothetical protein